MTARSSTGNFSKFGTYFLYKLRSLRPLIILNGIFALLSYPFAGGILAAYASNDAKLSAMRKQPNFWSDNLVDSPEYIALADKNSLLEALLIMAVIIGVGMLVAMFLTSYGIISKSFRWLYKKNIVDMDYSLPVSDDTRFFGDLLASFAGSLVPHLIAIFSGSILWRVAVGFLDGEGGADLILDALLAEQVMYTGLFSCVMFMAFALFVMALCGRGAEARIYPFVITAVVPLIHIICRAICLSDVYGMEYSVFDISEMLHISGTSPLGLIFVSIFYIFGVSGDVEDIRLPLFRLGTGMTAVLITVALFVAAYFLIRKRRAERVGSPFVFRWVKPVIPAVVTFAVAAPFMLAVFMVMSEWDESNSYTPSAVGIIVAMIIVTFILYVIMELISGKGFKKFHITLLKYIVTMAVSLLICIGLNASNGFGIGSYVPDADDVAEVSFLIEDNHSQNNLSATVSDEDSVSRIIDIHQSHPKKPNDDNTYRFTFSVDYRMKDGTIIYRNYRITQEEYEDYIRRALTPETFYKTNERYSALYYFEDGRHGIIEDITVMNNSAQHREYVVEIPYDVFLETYRKDCEGVTYDKAFCRGEGMYRVQLRMGYRVENDSQEGYYTRNEYIYVYSWMEETLALLAQHGVSDIGRVDLSAYKTAFLIEYPTDGGYHSTASPEIAFSLTGDDSVSQEQLRDYGYPDKYVYSEDYRLYYDAIADSGATSFVATTGYYDEKAIAVAVPIDEENLNVIEVDFKAYRLDINSADTAKMLINSSYGRSSYDDSDTVYSILLVDAENLAEIIDRGCPYDEYFISTEHYDMAAQIAAAA